MNMDDVKRMVVVPSSGHIGIDDEDYICEFDVEPPLAQYGPIKAVQFFATHGGVIEYMNGPPVGFPLRAEKKGELDARWCAQFIGPWLRGKAKKLAEDAANAERHREALGQAWESTRSAHRDVADALALHEHDLKGHELRVKQATARQAEPGRSATHLSQAESGLGHARNVRDHHAHHVARLAKEAERLTAAVDKATRDAKGYAEAAARAAAAAKAHKD